MIIKGENKKGKAGKIVDCQSFISLPLQSFGERLKFYVIYVSHADVFSVPLPF
jgi:hypothetical protein